MSDHFEQKSWIKLLSKINILSNASHVWQKLVNFEGLFQGFRTLTITFEVSIPKSLKASITNEKHIFPSGL